MVQLKGEETQDMYRPKGEMRTMFDAMRKAALEKCATVAVGDVTAIGSAEDALLCVVASTILGSEFWEESERLRTAGTTYLAIERKAMPDILKSADLLRKLNFSFFRPTLTARLRRMRG